MLLASDAFGDAVREVYEPDWPGRDKLVLHLEVCHKKLSLFIICLLRMMHHYSVNDVGILGKKEIGVLLSGVKPKTFCDLIIVC